MPKMLTEEDPTEYTSLEAGSIMKLAPRLAPLKSTRELVTVS